MYICKQCGKEFIPKGAAKGFYCSNNCYHESTKTGKIKICLQCGNSFYVWRGRVLQKYCSLVCRKKAKQIIKICPVCKKPFSVFRSLAYRYRVCSNECRTKFTLHKICLRCGKPFTAKRKDINHCSEECRRPPIYIKCLNCGKKFRISPCGKDNRRFCSFSCTRKYRGETSIEAIVKKTLQKLKIDFIQEYKIDSFKIDFFIPEYNICLEIDSEYWHSNPLKDIRRDKKLKKLGYEVIRIKTLDIQNVNNIDDLILTRLQLTSFS